MQLTIDINDYPHIYGKDGFIQPHLKAEGDMKTPTGKYKAIECLYRADKLSSEQLEIIQNLSIRSRKIIPNMLWCDDPNSNYYNQLIITDKKKILCCESYEELYRNDDLYDIVLVLDFNISPTIANKGSAIFIHVWGENKKYTEGCVAFKKDDLCKIIKKFINSAHLNTNQPPKEQQKKIDLIFNLLPTTQPHKQ